MRDEAKNSLRPASTSTLSTAKPPGVNSQQSTDQAWKMTRKATILLAFLCSLPCDAFVPLTRFALSNGGSRPALSVGGRRTPTKLSMKLDLVTYLRTEWISAALCTNQTPRSADVCLQLGSEDGRAVTFIPKTIRELYTSSVEPDGKLTVSARRQLKQQQERRNAAVVRLVDQPADDLKEMDDESVDVVISLQACARMMENGLDWKKSVREAARVLKPGGRLLFCEQTELGGDSYMEYVTSLATISESKANSKAGEESEKETYLVFEEGNFDDVDLVLTPHVAGVAIKSEDAGLTTVERKKKASQAEKDRVADLSIAAYERGIKKRRKKKKKSKKAESTETST